MKNQKGITLVALVITIVVLLILAGVTISMVMGPNGVLTNSQIAKEKSAKGTANDALSTALSSLSTNYYANSTNGTPIGNVTKTNLETQAPEYTFTEIGNTADGGKVVTMEKDKYKFKAAISPQLTVSEFKMIEGADGNRNEEFTTAIGNSTNAIGNSTNK